ncbi:uncharacterized protein BJ212DRAFT_1040167 [Suillus subaureus]|uniref:Uncharacterized protein n=1 Tax=Suillus subaureus TaxID=48587 RepID=A0A9P7J4K5_9AGAM|nr:uncharacterized protein BJ212DRAFT_1040167 [Suillus subaureus]KAG1802353.1 hypothetical protein BJ212DRAFT_1040167 [Suillus subaureus]
MPLRYQRVNLSLFTLCSKRFLPYKSAYFKLLVWIRRRRAADLNGKHRSLFCLIFFSPFA